jgi:hypothetical protein
VYGNPLMQEHRLYTSRLHPSLKLLEILFSLSNSHKSIKFKYNQKINLHHHHIPRFTHIITSLGFITEISCAGLFLLRSII